MLEKLPTIQKMMRQLQQVPFLAHKNVYKVTSHFLDMDQERLVAFCQALLEARKHVEQCSICCMWQEKNRDCFLCSDESRDNTVICVVEQWQDALLIERTETFRGMYHILGGVISPMDGISYKDLHIDQLVARVGLGGVQEVIFALNQTPEAETTAAFIARKLSVYQITITTLAKGVPIGSSLEFVDRLTVGKALQGRRPF